MHITIECLGASQRWCGSARVDLYLAEHSTVANAVEELAKQFPEFAKQRARIAVAMGDRVIADDCPLQPGDHIVLIPPVSGG
jgi:molybdopterin converting factor small subunit